LQSIKRNQHGYGKKTVFIVEHKLGARIYTYSAIIISIRRISVVVFLLVIFDSIGLIWVSNPMTSAKINELKLE
jgi:hypothetical protein